MPYHPAGRRWDRDVVPIDYSMQKEYDEGDQDRPVDHQHERTRVTTKRPAKVRRRDFPSSSLLRIGPAPTSQGANCHGVHRARVPKVPAGQKGSKPARSVANNKATEGSRVAEIEYSPASSSSTAHAQRREYNFITIPSSIFIFSGISLH